MKKNIFLACFVILFVSACSLLQNDPAPGVGEKAEAGYAACEPILAALERYKFERGEYPESLTALTPDYLTEVPTRVNDQDLQYSKAGASYSLSFHYLGPGMNTCTYTPKDGWKCSGAF